MISAAGNFHARFLGVVGALAADQRPESRAWATGDGIKRLAPLTSAAASRSSLSQYPPLNPLTVNPLYTPCNTPSIKIEVVYRGYRGGLLGV